MCAMSSARQYVFGVLVLGLALWIVCFIFFYVALNNTFQGSGHRHPSIPGQEAYDFLCEFAGAKAREAPALLQGSAYHTWKKRWVKLIVSLRSPSARHRSGKERREEGREDSKVSARVFLRIKRALARLPACKHPGSEQGVLRRT